MFFGCGSNNTKKMKIKIFFLVLLAIVSTQAVWAQGSPISPYREKNYSKDEIISFANKGTPLAKEFKKKIENNFLQATGEEKTLEEVFKEAVAIPLENYRFDNSRVERGKIISYSDILTTPDIFWVVKIKKESGDTLVVPIVKARCMNPVYFPKIFLPEKGKVLVEEKQVSLVVATSVPDVSEPQYRPIQNQKPVKKPFFKRKGVIAGICIIGGAIVTGTIIALSGGGGASGGPGGAPTSP